MEERKAASSGITMWHLFKNKKESCLLKAIKRGSEIYPLDLIKLKIQTFLLSGSCWP